MTTAVDEISFGLTTASGADDSPGMPATQSVIARLQAAAGRTEPWYIALLRAVGDWNLPSEEIDGRRWCYVIGGEALDWLTLAQRLGLAIPDAVPPADLEALLFRGRLPDGVSVERFRQLIGPFRYTAHLNFWYGVVVEEALQLVVEESIRKSRLARCYGDSDDQVVAEAFRHLYGETRDDLVEQFLAEAAGDWSDAPGTLSWSGWHEFTYWLFKRRVRKWHPARVASDTRRGLDRLRELRSDPLDEPADFLWPGDVSAPLSLKGGKPG